MMESKVSKLEALNLHNSMYIHTACFCLWCLFDSRETNQLDAVVISKQYDYYNFYIIIYIQLL